MLFGFDRFSGLVRPETNPLPGLLYVVDMKTDKVVKTIHGLPGITGLEYVPGLHKVYISNWGEEKIGVVDLRTMSVIKRLPTESKPNGIAYAEPFRKIYVVNTLGNASRRRLALSSNNAVPEAPIRWPEDTALRHTEPKEQD